MKQLGIWQNKVNLDPRFWLLFLLVGLLLKSIMNSLLYLRNVRLPVLDHFLAFPLVFWPLTKPFILGFSLGSNMLMKIWKCNLWSVPCGNHNPIMKSYQRKSSSCREKKRQQERKLVIKPAQSKKKLSKRTVLSQEGKISFCPHTGLMGVIENVGCKGHLCPRYQFEYLQASDSFVKSFLLSCIFKESSEVEETLIA